MLRIGQVAKTEGVSVDTLRYYEKIQLMPNVGRDQSGIRYYTERDLSRLRFIKRAQKMGFSLDEIGQLLGFREAPLDAKPQTRLLATRKLQQIEDHLLELTQLREELASLTRRCGGSTDQCPILAKLDSRQFDHYRNG